MQDLIAIRERNLETRVVRERKRVSFQSSDLWFTMWRVCAIVLCLVGVQRAPLAVGANTQAEDPKDPAGCAPPLEFLVQHNVAAQEHLAQLPSNGKCHAKGS